MLSFGELKGHKETACIAVLSVRGKLDLNMAIFVEEELKTFLVRIDGHTQKLLETSALDFSTLDYVDITKQIKDPSKNKQQQLMFALQDISELSEEAFHLMGLNKKTTL